MVPLAPKIERRTVLESSFKNQQGRKSWEKCYEGCLVFI